jgi:cytochrome c553
MDDAPPIAGRSPSYLARQIYDIQQGARMGPNAAMMRPVVANLTPDDIVAITAYIGSLAPSPGVTPTPPEFGPRRVTATAHR